MRSNSTRHHALHPALIVISLLTSLLLGACSGGISGTGDGGPPIVINPEANTSEDVAGSDSGDGLSDNADSGVSDGSTDVNADPVINTDPVENNAPAASPDTSLLLPAILQQLILLDENISAAQPLAIELNSLQQQVIASPGLTNTTTGTPTVNVSDVFDTTLSFSTQDTETLLAASSTTNTSYLFSSNAERTFHLLQQNQSLTLRYLNRTTNTLTQARITQLSDAITIMEADLNQNGQQSYLQLHLAAATSTVFSQHPTNTSIARQRELIDENGNVQTVQTCNAETQDCSLDNSWSNSSATSNEIFSIALSAIEDTLDAIATPDFDLPDEINEAVLTTAPDQSPTDAQIQCSIQRVSDTLRTFCYLPLPIPAAGQSITIFSETLAGGEVFYRLIE